MAIDSRREHSIGERIVPNGYMLICSCGWTFRVPTQNALARAAKLKAAAREHKRKHVE